MNIDKILEKIGALLTSNTALLRKEMTESEQRVKSEVKEAILESQKDTIDALANGPVPHKLYT